MVSDLIPHVLDGELLHLQVIERGGVTELRAEGKHVCSWPGKACTADLRAAVEAHKTSYMPLPGRWYRIIRLVALERAKARARGVVAAVTARDGDRLREVERRLAASERRGYRLHAALDWLGAANLSWAVRSEVPEPDAPEREMAFFPPFVAEPKKPKRKRKAGPRKPRRRYPNVRY